jgi:hypothetical protein
MSRDSAVGIATGYGLDGRRDAVRATVRARFFSSPLRLRAHPASYSMGTGGSFPGSKAAGPEADHSPPTSAEVKNTWIYIFIFPYVFMT